MAVPGAAIYAAGVERTGWGQRFVKFFRWKPSTYGQVWLLAVFGSGVPGFIIWSVVGHPLYEAVTNAASITFFGGRAAAVL
jgi:hypothetical protein